MCNESDFGSCGLLKHLPEIHIIKSDWAWNISS